MRRRTASSRAGHCFRIVLHSSAAAFPVASAFPAVPLHSINLDDCPAYAASTAALLQRGSSLTLRPVVAAELNAAKAAVVKEQKDGTAPIIGAPRELSLPPEWVAYTNATSNSSAVESTHNDAKTYHKRLLLAEQRLLRSLRLKDDTFLQQQFCAAVHRMREWAEVSATDEAAASEPLQDESNYSSLNRDLEKLQRGLGSVQDLMTPIVQSHKDLCQAQSVLRRFHCLLAATAGGPRHSIRGSNDFGATAQWAALTGSGSLNVLCRSNQQLRSDVVAPQVVTTIPLAPPSGALNRSFLCAVEEALGAAAAVNLWEYPQVRLSKTPMQAVAVAPLSHRIQALAITLLPSMQCFLNHLLNTAAPKPAQGKEGKAAESPAQPQIQVPLHELWDTTALHRSPHTAAFPPDTDFASNSNWGSPTPAPLDCLLLLQPSLLAVRERTTENAPLFLHSTPHLLPALQQPKSRGDQSLECVRVSPPAQVDHAMAPGFFALDCASSLLLPSSSSLSSIHRQLSDVLSNNSRQQLRSSRRTKHREPPETTLLGEIATPTSEGKSVPFTISLANGTNTLSEIAFSRVKIK